MYFPEKTLRFHKLYSTMICLIICLCSFVPTGLNAQFQEIKFEHLTLDNGLSHNTIKCLLRDSKGYLWIGTGHGLDRYNGEKIKIFEYSESSPNSLSYNYITSIFEDREHSIWVGTTSGLNLFDRKTEQFKRFFHSESDSFSISNNIINSVISDKRGSIWIATRYGLNLFLKEKGIFKKFFPSTKNQTEINNITDLSIDKNGIIWFSTNSNLVCCINPITEKIISYTVPLSSTWKALSSIAIDPVGNIWIGTKADGLILFEPNNKRFTKIPIKSDGTGSFGADIEDLYIEDAAQLLIGINGGGFARLNLKTREIQYCRNNQNDPSSLNSNGVWSVYKDSEGLLYVGTYNGGLNIYNPNKGRFKTYSHNPQNPNTISSNFIFRFFEDSYGLIWIGTDEGGLSLFNPKLNTFKTFKNDPNNPYSISGNTVLCIKEDKNHDIWVGTWANGLNRFERKSGKFYRYQSRSDDPTSLPSNNIFDIELNGKGQIWVATYEKGVFLFHSRKGVIKRFIKNNEGKNSISNNTARLIKNINPHKLGFVTLNGYCEYDSVRHCFTSIKALDKTQLYDVHKDDKGNLWVATYDKGLWVIDKKGVVTKYSKENGFPSDVVMGIVSDKNKNIWILTDVGVSKYDPRSNRFLHYSSLDGIVGKQFTNNAILYSRDGTLYFGGNNGFNTINPQSVHPNKIIPPVYIDEFRIFNNLVTPNTAESPLKVVISETKEINLTYKQSMISFGFTAVNMTFPQKSIYAYRMKGYDKDWNYSTADRKFATYTNLEPGDYTFEVKATNNDGIWNESPASIRIIIAPPFWKTNIAYLLYLILFIGGILRLRYSITRRYELKNQQESERLESQKTKELSELRLRFFTNISHEFRTPLTLLIGPLNRSIQKAVAANQPDIEAQVRLALQNAKELEHLTDQLLDFRKIETNNMKLDLVQGDIIVFQKNIYDKFKLLAETKKIDFEFVHDGMNENAFFDADKIEKICNNLLSNAFKFTAENGKITFKVNATSLSRVEISVSDSGKGILPEHLDLIFNPFYQVPEMNTQTNAGTGIGLALCKELIELHKGTIQVSSESGKGSCFSIDFPVTRESYDYQQDVPELIISNELNILQDVDHPFEMSQVNLPNQVADINSPLILVVEDHTGLREYVMSVLSPFYRVISASNGREGLEMALENSPDLIITDVMMPEMNGIEMTSQIKKDIHTSHIPVIMLTALSSDENKIKGLDMGADDYITKPFNHELLLLKLRNLFELRQKWREYYKVNFDNSSSEELDEPQTYLVNNELDEKFIKRCHELVVNHLSDSDFDVNQFAVELNVSVSLLYLKMNALVGQTPADLLRDSRMKKAGELIKQKVLTISEIATEVGFNDSSHFSRTFKKYYGVAPSQFQ
ncbi:MAG: two-component regulator propeller domain-containing protein [Paludibacter sp.]